jgi:hypothetical protein
VKSKDLLEKATVEKRRLCDKLKKMEGEVALLDEVSKIGEYQQVCFLLFKRELRMQHCMAIVELISQKSRVSKGENPNNLSEAIGRVHSTVNDLLTDYDRIKRNGISTTKYVAMEKELKLLKESMAASKTLGPSMFVF